MNQAKTNQLTIEKTFRLLMTPLSSDESHKLELKLALNGCQEPILVWEQILIDGLPQYEICSRQNIPYTIRHMDFKCQEEALLWVCRRQMRRNDISEEARRYLVGKQYLIQRVIHQQQKGTSLMRFSAANIMEEYQVTSASVQRYVRYAKAIDVIAEIVPEFAYQILTGNCKVTYDHTIAMVTMDKKELIRISSDILAKPLSTVRYRESRKSITGVTSGKPGPKAPEPPKIKAMPAYDPDAEVVGLTLTIPSWMSSIRRTKTAADLTAISSTAREHLTEALLALQNTAQEMLSAIGEDI